MGERYFITGAQGCIGSWIVKTLLERGDEAIVFDRSDDSRRLAAIMSATDLARVRFSLGDITDRAAVSSALHESEAKCVIHLAGLQVPTCKTDPLAGALVNVIGTLNVFEAARETQAKAIVYASSAAVYGINDDVVAVDESAPTDPSTHYGVFKLTNEGNARIYFLDHGLSSVGLRPLTVYGVNRDTGLTSDPTKAMEVRRARPSVSHSFQRRDRLSIRRRHRRGVHRVCRQSTARRARFQPARRNVNRRPHRQLY